MASYPLGNQSVVLSYDRAGRLIQQSGALARQYDYDRLDRLTGTTSAINQLFAYDANGNRESFTQDDELSDYDNASTSNRILGISGADSRVYDYDAAGNTLSDGLRTYEYNTANRLSRITRGSVVVDNHYNGLGQRVRKLVSGGESREVRYVYDEAGLTVGEYNADGTLINEVVYLGDMPVLLLRPSGVFSIQADQLNAPRAVLTSAQVMVWKWDSTAFGESLANEDVDGNGVPLKFNWRFPGQLFDAETGLHYNYFRDYDPVTGRYVESDPIGLGGGLNTYNYATGNPLSYIDQLGLAVSWGGTVTSGGATAGVGGQLLKFELESECKCGKKVRISGFASFVTAGAGINIKSLGGLGELSGNGGKITLTDQYATCPEASRANGMAWISGISLTVGAGGTLFPSIKLGRLHMSDWIDGPSFGLDVSVTSTLYGQSAVTSETSEPCCGG